MSLFDITQHCMRDAGNDIYTQLFTEDDVLYSIFVFQGSILSDGFSQSIMVSGISYCV